MIERIDIEFNDGQKTTYQATCDLKLEFDTDSNFVMITEVYPTNKYDHFISADSIHILSCNHVIKMPVDGLTTDPRLGRGQDETPVPQNEVYLVLSKEERAKGFVRPLRKSYKHVGERPKYETRPLTVEEQVNYPDSDYVLYETYPKDSSVVGRFWTNAQLRSGCCQVTTISLDLCETYARDPKFYGSTYCTTCSKYRPVAEFIWCEDGERVGS